MHNEIEKKAKIDRFLKDERMAEAVYQALIDSFMKERRTESVQILAASRIAINLLQDGWKDLQKYKTDDSKYINNQKQVGL